MLISSKTTLCQGCFQTFGGQCILLHFIYVHLIYFLADVVFSDLWSDKKISKIPAVKIFNSVNKMKQEF